MSPPRAHGGVSASSSAIRWNDGGGLRLAGLGRGPWAAGRARCGRPPRGGVRRDDGDPADTGDVRSTLAPSGRFRAGSGPARPPGRSPRPGRRWPPSACRRRRTAVRRRHRRVDAGHGAARGHGGSRGTPEVRSKAVNSPVAASTAVIIRGRSGKSCHQKRLDHVQPLLLRRVGRFSAARASAPTRRRNSSRPRLRSIAQPYWARARVSRGDLPRRGLQLAGVHVPSSSPVATRAPDHRPGRGAHDQIGGAEVMPASASPAIRPISHAIP